MSHRLSVACPTAPFQEIQSLDAPVSREPDAGPLVEDVELDVPGPQVRVLSTQVNRLVGDFIASLDPRQRDLANRVFWQDQPKIQVARDLGVSPATITKRMAGIRTAGRQFFSGHADDWFVV